MREWPILSSTICGIAATGRTESKCKPVAGMDLEADAGAVLGGPAQALQLVGDPASSPSTTASQ